MKIGGPFWGAPIHSQSIVDELLRRVSVASEDDPSLATGKRMRGVLTTISEELKDVPFYYSLASMAHELGCIMPTLTHAFSALVNAGYRVSQFHHEPLAIKTDAPDHVVWDMMRAHCVLHPPNMNGGKLKGKAKRLANGKQNSRQFQQQQQKNSSNASEGGVTNSSDEVVVTDTTDATTTTTTSTVNDHSTSVAAAGEEGGAVVEEAAQVTEHVKIRQAILSKPSATAIDFTYNNSWNLGSKLQQSSDPNSSSSSAALSSSLDAGHVSVGGSLSSTHQAKTQAQAQASEEAHRAAKKKKRVARFLPNPEPGWGPKRRAGSGPAVTEAAADEADEEVDTDAAVGNDDKMF